MGKRKKPAKRGRPTKYSAELARQIIAEVRAGESFSEVCHRHRIAPSTFYGWVASGEFPEFSEGVKAAKNQRVAALEERVVTASRKDWRAALELCKVYDPKRFAPRVRVHVEEELTDVVRRLKAKLTPDVYEQVLVAIVEGDREPGAEPTPLDEAATDHRAGGEAVQPAPAQPATEVIPRP